MDLNEVNQENIETDGGDVVGRDKNDYSVNVHNHLRPVNQYMQDLISKFKEDEKNNCRITDIIDNLNHYNVNIDDDQVFDLKYKLEAGGRSSEYKRAALLKERIAKKIKLNEQSEAAQEIYAYVLSQICSDFHLYIAPHLSENTIPNINILIDEKVIKPAMETLGENVLRLLKDDINGMVYFLTGNCHIKWV